MHGRDSDCECRTSGCVPSVSPMCACSATPIPEPLRVPGALRMTRAVDNQTQRVARLPGVLQVPACDGRRTLPRRTPQVSAPPPGRGPAVRNLAGGDYLENELEIGVARAVRADLFVQFRWPPRRCEFLPQALNPAALPATALGGAKWLVVACEDDFVLPRQGGGLGAFDPGDDVRALDPELLYKLSYRFRCAGRWYHEQGFQIAALQTVQGRAAIAELARIDRSYFAGVFDPAGAVEPPTGLCFDGHVPIPGIQFRQVRLWGAIVPNESYVVVQVRPWRQERENPLQPVKVTIDASYNANQARIFISAAIDPNDPQRIVDLAAGQRFEIVHELFHAIQWHLAPNFMAKAYLSSDYYWVIEGMPGAVTLRLRMLLTGESAQQTVDDALRQGSEGIRPRDWGIALNGLPQHPADNGVGFLAWSAQHRYQVRSGGGLVLFCVRADQSIGYLAGVLTGLERESVAWPDDAAQLPQSYGTMHRVLSEHSAQLHAQPARLTGLSAAYIRAVVLSGQYYAPADLAAADLDEWRRSRGCGGVVSQIPGPQAPFPNDLAPFQSRCAAFQSTNRNQQRLRFEREDVPRQLSVYYVLQGAESPGLDGLVVSNLARVDAPGAAREIAQFNICRVDENAADDTIVRASTRLSTR